MNKQHPVKKPGRKASDYVVGITIFLFLAVLLQLFRWQVLDFDRFNNLATAQLSLQQDVFTKRGTIYTQDGVVLAVDSPSWNIIISLSNAVDQSKFITQKDQIFTELASILDTQPEELQQAFNPKALTYQVLFRGITKREKDILDQKKYLGIYAEDSIKRLYPNGTLFSHVIGYVGTDSFGRPQGNYGVEGFFWGDIKGKEGASEQEKDLSGKAIISKQYKNIQYREGKNIVLTVNSGIQKKVEKILAEGVQSQRGDRGSVIIVNPKTGEIIAMATYPDYDPNEFWKVQDISTFRNQAVASPYEYGSVQKPLTIAMAMEEGKLKETDICNDTGKLKVDEETIYNFNHTRYGRITPKEVLEHSDNICAATYGLSVGAKAMYGYLTRLGIGVPMVIGESEEETSILKLPEKWIPIDTATTSFGQAISATPLQFISAMSTIANKGIRMNPMLVKKIYNNEEEINIEPTSAGRIFSEKTATSVAKMMEFAVSKRPEMQKYRGIYSIAGKTGTAQVAKSGSSGYYEDRVNVTYVGFSPAIDARFIMLVKVENPRNAGLANLTVLPLWMKIFDSIKDDLGVPRIK